MRVAFHSPLENSLSSSVPDSENFYALKSTGELWIIVSARFSDSCFCPLLRAQMMEFQIRYSFDMLRQRLLPRFLFLGDCLLMQSANFN